MFDELKNYSANEIKNHVDKPIRCIIHSSERGKVIIQHAIMGYDSENGIYYLCQDIIKGSILYPDRKGYRYSWKLRPEHPEACKIYELELLK